MKTPWHTEKIETLFKTFQTSPHGLRSADIEKRQQQYGKNVLEKKKRVTLWDIFWEQFKSPFIYILIVAAVIVLALGDIIDGVIILGIIFVNALIGTVQEGKARDTLAALQNVVVSKATVLRDGTPTVLADTEIVPGDILLLKDGDIIPADARLLEANNLELNESALTGESTVVNKKQELLTDEALQPADQINMVFRGTYVVSGLGRAVVVATGTETAIGAIAQKLDQLHADVPLKQNIQNLSRVVIVVVSIVSIIIFIAGLVGGNTFTQMFLTVVAVAVSAIPESLPVVVTLVLATGVWRMAKRNALVKRLQAVEALGQANVIALDKTGTITKNQMMVEKLYVNGELHTVTGDGYEPKGSIEKDGEIIVPTTHEGIMLAAKVAAFTSIGQVAHDTETDTWEHVMGDPTEVSLIVFAEKVGIPKNELEKQYPKILEIPFDYETKHHTAVHTIDGKPFLATSGSPEVILAHATSEWRDGKVQPLTKKRKEEIEEQMALLSKEGYRLLALGAHFHPPKQVSKDNLPELTLIAFTAITDAIRQDVEVAVSAARTAGMRVVMITGDHKDTAVAIAQKVGIYTDGDQVLTGADITSLSDNELDTALGIVTVFARVAPEHKLRIIESFKRRGETVAMTGDGINDALSLVAADLGVAMGRVGTEVAREAADIILLDDNFDNIRAAVEEGRAIYYTIRKAVLYLLATNIGELLVIAVAVLLGWPLPLLATQIIWLNMVTDTFLVAALALEPKSDSLLERRFKKPSPYLVDWAMGLRILLTGIVMTAGTLYLFMQFVDVDMTKAWTVSLTVLTVFQWYNIWNIRSTRRSVFGQNPFSNPWLVAGLLLVIVLHFVALHVPFMQTILHTTPLSLQEWGIILLVGTSVIIVEELRKLCMFLIRRAW